MNLAPGNEPYTSKSFESRNTSRPNCRLFPESNKIILMIVTEICTNNKNVLLYFNRRIHDARGYKIELVTVVYSRKFLTRIIKVKVVYRNGIELTKRPQTVSMCFL